MTAPQGYTELCEGTPAAYRRHLRAGQTHPECRAAHAADNAAWREANKDSVNRRRRWYRKRQEWRKRMLAKGS